MIRMMAMLHIEPAGIGRTRPPHTAVPRHPYQPSIVQRATRAPITHSVRAAEIVALDDALQELQLAIIKQIPPLHNATLPRARSRHKASHAFR